MRYREITHLYTIPYCYPFVSVLTLHTSLRDRFERWIDARSGRFRALHKQRDGGDWWTVHIGCATEADQGQFDQVWDARREAEPDVPDAAEQAFDVAKNILT